MYKTPKLKLQRFSGNHLIYFKWFQIYKSNRCTNTKDFSIQRTEKEGEGWAHSMRSRQWKKETDDITAYPQNKEKNSLRNSMLKLCMQNIQLKYEF